MALKSTQNKEKIDTVWLWQSSNPKAYWTWRQDTNIKKWPPVSCSHIQRKQGQGHRCTKRHKYTHKDRQTDPPTQAPAEKKTKKQINKALKKKRSHINYNWSLENWVWFECSTRGTIISWRWIQTQGKKKKQPLFYALTFSGAVALANSRKQCLAHS